MNENNRPLNIRIFLSSPGDVSQERKIVYEEIDQFIYNNPSFKSRVNLEAIGFDRTGKYVPAEASMGPQNAIDKRLPLSSECDIVFVIFWSRMGTLMDIEKYKKPLEYQYKVEGTDKPEWFFSGTEWEYVTALEEVKKNNREYPHVYVFNKIPVNVSFVDMDEQILQVKRLGRFFEQFNKQHEGYFRKNAEPYKTLEEFKEKIRRTLAIVVKEIIEDKEPPEKFLARQKNKSPKAVFKWEGSPFPRIKNIYRK